MADSALNVNFAVAVATLRNAAARFLWKSSTVSPTLGRLMKWKDWVDESLLQLQQAKMDPAAALALELVTAGRLNVNGGNAMNVNGTDIVLSAGWGASRSIGAATVSGTGSCFLVGDIIPSGAGIAANPTVTVTFPGGARASVPQGAHVMDWNFNSSAGAHDWTVDGISATTLTIRHRGTPVTDQRVGIFVTVIG